VGNQHQPKTRTERNNPNDQILTQSVHMNLIKIEHLPETLLRLQWFTKQLLCKTFIKKKKKTPNKQWDFSRVHVSYSTFVQFLGHKSQKKCLLLRNLHVPFMAGLI
jgi:hypothetical protein